MILPVIIFPSNGQTHRFQLQRAPQFSRRPTPSLPWRWRSFTGRKAPFNSFLQGQDVQVLVRDNNVDQALRALKKKLQREGVFREMKLRDHYEKPSEKRAREKAEAVRRARKVARKRAQRDGLLPVKVKPVR
jgi:small subunit ribosomal protein S21